MKLLALTAILSSLLATSTATATTKAPSLKLTHKKQLTLPRIIGGVEAPKGERPWMASLQSGGQHFCGGSVIDRQWILTAAHCVEDVTDPSSLDIKVNFTRLDDPNTGETHKVSDIYVNQGYLAGESKDIALLKLTSKVSDAIASINLADENTMLAAASAGKIASVSGWGNTSADGESFPQKLQKVEVPIVSNQVCNSAEAYNGQIQDTEMCAGLAAGGKDSCQGDSGGPLVVKQGGEFIQAGVVSWGEGCAVANKYGVYARVASFKQWIADVKSGKVESHDGNSSGNGNTDNGNNSQLVNAQVLTGLSGELNSQAYYTIEVPEDAHILWIDTKGTIGDADLYLKKGEQPSLDDFDYAPFEQGSNEHILIRAPEAGTWHLMVHGYENYQQLELALFSR